MCGRIICSLPTKNPQRPVTCSLLFIVDSKTRQIEEVNEGVDYGIKKRRNASAGKADEIDNNEKFLKGVRICRECRPILLYVHPPVLPVSILFIPHHSREQYQQEKIHIPLFVRLHEVIYPYSSTLFFYLTLTNQGLHHTRTRNRRGSPPVSRARCRIKVLSYIFCGQPYLTFFYLATTINHRRKLLQLGNAFLKHSASTTLLQRGFHNFLAQMDLSARKAAFRLQS